LAFPAAAVLRALRIPVIQENNGPYEDMYIAYPWTKRLSMFLEGITDVQYRWAAALITVTPQLAAWLSARTGRDDVYVIPNGANTELFHPAARSGRALPDKYVFFFGALAAWQGIDSLLAAVSDPQWPAGVHLVIAGDGAERKSVEACASHNEAVIYLGSVPYADIPGILAGSLAGLSPKSDLGGRTATGLSPLKVYETMACGVPVILSRFPGVAGIVEEAGAGISVPPANPSALAAAVNRIATDGVLRRHMGEAARQLVENGHSWDARAGATAAAIDTAVCGSTTLTAGEIPIAS
jgi:glycosyltransferase involved in cell wall biosynthesis